MLLKKICLMTLCAVVTAMSLAACSSGKTDPSGSSSAADSMGAQSAQSADAETDTQSGKITVKIGHITELTNLDRFANYGSGGDDTGLLWADPLAFSDHLGTYTPALATKWEPSADYTAWTFTLRKGVKFSDGSDFTSFDVKRTFERLFEDETLVDVNAWGGFDRVETPDDYTAIIHLKDIMPTFMDEIGRVPVINGKAYDANKSGYFMKPTGTGPYILKSFDAMSGITVFEKNADWWGWSETGKTTNVDEIIYEYILDSTTRVSALQSGDVDMVFQITLDNLTLLDSSEFNIDEIKSDNHVHLAMQCREGSIFANKDLREALSLSIDRQALVDSILGGGTASTWSVPKGNAGYIADKGYVYDPVKAKELVAASGYSGEKIKLLINPSMTSGSEVCQAIQAMAEQVGLNIELDPTEYATFVDRRDAGDFDVFFGSFAATCGDPQVEAGIIMAFNVFQTNYENAELTELCNSTRGIADKAERTKVLERVFSIEMEEFAPFVYLYDSSFCYASTNKLSGYKIFADGSADLRFMTLK